MTEDTLEMEFKQFFKKHRLAEKKKSINEQELMVMKQIKKLLGENDE